MCRQTTFLKLIIVNTLSLMANSINVYARSIEIEENANSTILSLPLSICIVGVVIVAATGGFCLFHTKKQKRHSEEFLTKPSQTISNTTSNDNSPKSSINDINEVGETDIAVRVDQKVNDNDEDRSESQNEEPKKRVSLIGSILNRKKEHRSSKMKITEDRSLNSISTNEDWINEQKMKDNDEENNMEIYDDEYEENNSNDGFWCSDLEPIQSSSANIPERPESYAVPSLGKSGSVIVRGSSVIARAASERIPARKHSVIIVDNNIKGKSSEGPSKLGGEILPTRVKSWKDNDINKEIMEIMKDLEDQERLENENN